MHMRIYATSKRPADYGLDEEGKVQSSREKRSARRPPDTRGAVVAGGGNASAVGEERHPGHDAAVAFVSAQFLAGRRFPDAHGAVGVTTGDDPLAVRRERDAVGVWGLDPLPFLARPHVPEAHLVAGVVRDQAL